MAVSVTAISGSTAQTEGRSEDVWGRRRVGLYRVTMDSSYVTGGEPFDPIAFGFQGPVAAVFISTRKVAVSVDTKFDYDFVNETIFGTVLSTGVQIANATDLSTVVLDVVVVGE